MNISMQLRFPQYWPICPQFNISKGPAMSENTCTAPADTTPLSGIVGPQMIDIGGRRLALTCTGVGSPPVILETGLGAESNEWALVQDQTSTAVHVMRYDRANRGASDRATGPRTALD